MKIKVNPDKVFVKEIKQQLKENNGYCPCQTKKNMDTKCICKDFKENTKVGEYCICGLYYKEG